MDRAAYLVLVNVSPDEWSYRIDDQRKLVGRSAAAKIRVPDRYLQVSRRHAEVWRQRGQNWLSDAGSRGGTFVNGIQLRPGRPIHIAVGDCIGLCDVELRVVGEVSRLAELIADVGVAPVLIDHGLQTCGTVVERPQQNGYVHVALRRLSPAELDILLWMYRGYIEYEELGRALHRSPHTIRTQMASIFKKLNLHSRAGALGWLRKIGSKGFSDSDLDRPTEA